MPTYTITTTPARLTPSQKQSLVTTITTIHATEGKAPPYLVQCLFHEIPTSNWFINARPVPKDQIWINGIIRAGRTDAQKTAMVARLMRECGEVLGLGEGYVWAYICDAEKTGEFGGVLPEPGREKEWLAAVPREARQRHGLPMD